jgi:integrase
MSRKPFFRAFDGWWYAQIRVGAKRKQVKLVKGRDNEQEAYRAFCRLMAESGACVPEPTKLAVAAVCDLFLDHSQRHNEPATYAWYNKYLQDFCAHHGRLMVCDVRPFHVNRWLDLHGGWRVGSRRCAIAAVKRVFNWALSEGLIRETPLRSLVKPAGRRRERILAEEERRLIVAAIRDQAFRDFVFALEETGCRPSEVRKVTAAHANVEEGVWILPEHKTRTKTGQPRLVYLTPSMQELTSRLAQRYPTGPLFRNARGRPFSRNGIRCRFRRLRKKIPQLEGVNSYTYRHTYTTDALERGVSVAAVAELVGHKDLQMIAEHYGHLSQKRKHLLEAARKAAGYASKLPEEGKTP